VCSASVAPAVAVPLKSADGSDAGTAQVALRVADASTAQGVVHRYLVMVRNNARQGSASSLTRAEVRGGGRKPYNQKGTGNARRGSTTTPLTRGGGVAFGPQPRDYGIRMNKKERRLAMATALQNAAAAGDLQAVEALGSWDSGRTADLVRGLAAQGADPSVGRVLLITGAFNPMLARAARNVRGLVLSTADRLHVADVLGAGRIVVDVDALAFLAEFLGEKGEGFASHDALD